MVKRIISVLIASALLLTAFSSLFTASAAYSWVGSWGTPAIESGVVLGSDSVLSESGIHLRDYVPANSTIRTIITPTLGGTKLRLKFSNLYGNEAITLNEVTVAKTGVTDDVVVGDTITQVTFNHGDTSITIAAGSEIYSDEISFSVKAMEKLSVSVYFKKATPMYVIGLYGGTSYLCNGLGNRTHNENMTVFASKLTFISDSITYHTIPFLTRLDVYAQDAYSVVLLGDSTLTNDIYLYLAQKVRSAGITNIGFVMSGIIGNSLLRDGEGLLGKVYGEAMLERAYRDAYSIPGVRHIIIKIGVNDILHPMLRSNEGSLPKVSAAQVLEGYRELSRQNNNPGIQLHLCTRTPFKGYTRNFLGDNDLTWTQEAEDTLVEINSWIKYASEDYYTDCINLDKLRDPQDSTKLRSQLTSDGVHFNTLGQIAAADLIPESAYGVSGNITDIATLLNVNPYSATANQPSSGAQTTSPSGGETTTSSDNAGAGSSGTQSATTTAPSADSQQSATQNGASVITPAGDGSQQSANQILVDGQGENAVNASSGAVTGSVSDSSTRRAAGFAVLAAVSVAIIAIASTMLYKLNPKKKQLSRSTYTRPKRRKSV